MYIYISIGFHWCFPASHATFRLSRTDDVIQVQLGPGHRHWHREAISWRLLGGQRGEGSDCEEMYDYCMVDMKRLNMNIVVNILMSGY